MNGSTRYKELLNTRGISLTALGIREIALERDDALLAIELLKADGIPILGGDVYARKGDGIEVAYANWYTRRRDREDLDGYSVRSWKETSEYIKRYPQQGDIIPLFTLVPDYELRP